MVDYVCQFFSQPMFMFTFKSMTPLLSTNNHIQNAECFFKDKYTNLKKVRFTFQKKIKIKIELWFGLVWFGFLRKRFTHYVVDIWTLA